MSRRKRQRGFTLIEAIVALVLIATTGMALFGWINSNIIALNRVQEQNSTNAATLNVVEYMNGINPMATPDGRADLGAYTLSWTSRPVTDVVDGASYPMGVSLYQLALYESKINVAKPGGQLWFDFTMQQVGYKKVRSIARPF